ncbi:metal-dependent hydrolase family protein [Candidimonas nitroreducens]|uniref:Amidohydrolase n=1 Tax=Candidimonas nitroreducens TaxID=683354 RepID=A0A225M6E0_9BURK|nr:amidohydrolase family protein [Candidimonas nitroreducens]OWT56262.1 amidohydrolase [Candidimonas nitroreducens]
MEDRTIVFAVGRLIDGRSPEPRPDVSVVVRGSRIIEVRPTEALDIPEASDCLRVDLTDRVLLPGLIDSHVHLWGELTLDHFHNIGVPKEVKILRAARDLESLIKAGFTSVRDCGSKFAVHLRTAVEEGTLLGPRIVTPYCWLSHTSGHGDLTFLPPEWADVVSIKSRIVDGVDQCRKACREHFRIGADFLKVVTSGGIMSEIVSAKEAQFTLDEVRTVVEEADRVGTFVASHAGGNAGVRLALEAGVKTIEHGYFLDDPEVFELMLEKRIVYVPTLCVSKKLAQGAAYGVGSIAVRKAQETLGPHSRAFQLARCAGIPIAMGTDFVGGPLLPHGENAQELENLVEGGMTPMQAIMAATRVASMALGLPDEIGTIQEGKSADLLVVDDDPLGNISVLTKKNHIRMVVKEGQVLVDKDGKAGAPCEIRSPFTVSAAASAPAGAR